MSEPEITINGNRLTDAQAIAVRVALTHSTFNCGDDKQGKAMKKQYEKLRDEVVLLLLRAKT